MTLALTRLSFHPVFLSVCSAWRMTFVMRVRRGVICGSIFCNAFQVESAAALTGLLSALCHLPAPSPSKRGCCLFSFPFPSFSARPAYSPHKLQSLFSTTFFPPSTTPSTKNVRQLPSLHYRSPPPSRTHNPGGRRPLQSAASSSPQADPSPPPRH